VAEGNVLVGSRIAVTGDIDDVVSERAFTIGDP
jgi:hypothetical protein